MNDGIIREAMISKDGAYRYTLRRIWGDREKFVTWVMLNPSTADAEKDDPTIRRCIDYSKTWGYGALTVVNLFPLRTPEPKVLLAALKDAPEPDDVRRINTGVLESETVFNNPGLVICAWGVNGGFRNRAKQTVGHLIEMGAQLSTLKLTEDRHPSHPLYLPKTLKPTPWNGR